MIEAFPPPHATHAYESASRAVSIVLRANGVRTTDLQVLYEALEERDEMLGLSDVSRNGFLQEILR